jgi:TP901 family phage tail tape measure protein
MNVFRVFATMSLADMISGPLGMIRRATGKVDQGFGGLSARAGRLALSLAPAAIASAVLLSTFGAMTGSAIAFESTMADVAKVVDFETNAELKAMGDTILDLSGRIPMAAEGLGAIVSAAAQSGIAKDNLVEFAEQAAKMGVAFDLSGDLAGKMMADWRAGMNLSLPRVYALADAVNHLSNNMNATAPALGEVIQRVGPLAMAAGLAETEVAALGAAILAAGASPEIAATALRKMVSTLVLGSAMSDRQAEAFRNLGFDTVQMAKDMQTDAQGTISRVLQALADKPKELQVSLLTEMFGEQGLSAIAPLLANMGNLSQAFTLVGDSAAYAGSMEAEFTSRAATTENALTLLRHKLTALAVSIGNAFLPALKWGAALLGGIAEVLRAILGSTVGQWLLRIVAALAGAIVGLTAFSAGLWMVKGLVPLVVKALAPLKAALLAIPLPVWIIIGVFAAFYQAYKHNFGGFADFVDGVWKKVSLIFKGVRAAISGMTDGIWEIRGELATEIKAEGLVGVISTISKVYYRLVSFFSGLAAAIGPYLERLGNIFGKVFDGIGKAFGKIGKLFEPVLRLLSGGEITSSADEWERWGGILGHIAGFILEALGTALQLIINLASLVIDAVRLVGAVLSGDWLKAGEIFGEMLDTLGDSVLAIGDLFGFGDTLRAVGRDVVAFAEAIGQSVSEFFSDVADAGRSILDFFGSIGDGISSAWQSVTDFIAGIDLYESGKAIIDTLVDGVISAASSLWESITGIFAKIRDLLPFSDAKEGPLSELTASGASIMTTLGEGVLSMADYFIDSILGVFSGLGGLLDWFFGDDEDKEPEQSGGAIPEPAMPDYPISSGGLLGGGAATARPTESSGGVSIHIDNLNLPNATDAKSLWADLQELIAEYDGVEA